MPWKGVAVSEQRQRFIEYYLLNFFSISQLAERFGTEQFLFMVEAEPLSTKLLIVQLPVIPVISSSYFL